MTRSFIGVVCGLKSEAQAVAAAKVDQSKLRIGISGANAARAEEIARGFCNDGASAILSVGVSGGLDPALKPEEIATELREAAELDTVMTNSFGFGGTNGSMLLSRYRG